MKPPAADSSFAPSPAMGRLLITLAALLWSTGGAFTKVLTKDTFLELNDPAINPLQIACFRALFASLVLLPTVRRKDIPHPTLPRRWGRVGWGARETHCQIALTEAKRGLVESSFIVNSTRHPSPGPLPRRER
jgi:hypothetical protein